MAFASPAISAPRRPAASLLVAPELPGPAELRDELTRRRLLSAVEHLPELTVEHFDRAWWDGQARVACLVVRGGRRVRRLRVVGPGGGGGVGVACGSSRPRASASWCPSPGGSPTGGWRHAGGRAVRSSSVHGARNV